MHDVVAERRLVEERQVPEIEVHGPQRPRDHGMREHAERVNPVVGEQRTEQRPRQPGDDRQRRELAEQHVLRHVHEEELLLTPRIERREERERDQAETHAERPAAPGGDGRPTTGERPRAAVVERTRRGRWRRGRADRTSSSSAPRARRGRPRVGGSQRLSIDSRRGRADVRRRRRLDRQGRRRRVAAARRGGVDGRHAASALSPAFTRSTTRGCWPRRPTRWARSSCSRGSEAAAELRRRPGRPLHQRRDHLRGRSARPPRLRRREHDRSGAGGRAGGGRGGGLPSGRRRADRRRDRRAARHLSGRRAGFRGHVRGRRRPRPRHRRLTRCRRRRSWWGCRRRAFTRTGSRSSGRCSRTRTTTATTS